MPSVRVPSGVVHLVGRPDEDVSGLVLRIGARDAMPAVSSQRRVVSEAPRPGGDQRIRATDVADRFPVADLVVLQPEPAASWPEQRVASDREDAIRMRLFAADLTSRGVPHVLVLPRLDAAFAATALQIVARMLARHGVPDLETLVACASQIQRAVVSHEGDRAVAVEVALDVTICASGGIQTEMERS